jgi:hypothetical protein
VVTAPDAPHDELAVADAADVSPAASRTPERTTEASRIGLIRPRSTA